MSFYWLTISVEAVDMAQACGVAHEIANERKGEIIGVTHEPPQGATIVGNMHEDEL